MDAPEHILEEIAREYEETLNVPDTKPEPQWTLMPVGLIGAGKTTIVKPLAERLGLIRLSTDDVREMLKERGYSYAGCREIIQTISKKYLDQGYSLAFDANTGSKAGIVYNERNKKKYPHVEQIFIHINPPEEFILNKLKNYKHTWLFKDGDNAVSSYFENKESFELPDLPFVYEFDTSKENIEEQIEEAVVTINQALER